MSRPHTITVQYNTRKRCWTVICNDPADCLVGVRFYKDMQKAISFAHEQCYRILDLNFSSELHVYDRNGSRSYSVSPETFARNWETDIHYQATRDFCGVGAMERIA